MVFHVFVCVCLCVCVCVLVAHFSSNQFSRSVMSNSLWLLGLQHARLSCPSPIPGACSNPCPSSQWCHPTVSSCHPLLPLPLIFPSIRVFLMSLFFTSGDQRIGVSASSISPSNEYSGLISFRIDWFDPLAVQGTLKSLCQHHGSKTSVLWRSPFFIV